MRRDVVIRTVINGMAFDARAQNSLSDQGDPAGAEAAFGDLGWQGLARLNRS